MNTPETVDQPAHAAGWRVVAPFRFREYRLLRDLQRMGMPAVVPQGVVAGRLVDSPPDAGQRALEPVRVMQKLRYIERSDRIEARLCRNFGITVKLLPTPPLRMPDRVEVRVLHPELTRPDGRQSAETRFPSYVVDGLSHIGFTFEHDWEMAPGPWTMIVSLRGDEIARKDFTVTLPPPGAPNSDCGIG